MQVLATVFAWMDWISSSVTLGKVINEEKDLYNIQLSRVYDVCDGVTHLEIQLTCIDISTNDFQMKNILN